MVCINAQILNQNLKFTYVHINTASISNSCITLKLEINRNSIIKCLNIFPKSHGNLLLLHSQHKYVAINSNENSFVTSQLPCDCLSFFVLLIELLYMKNILMPYIFLSCMYKHFLPTSFFVSLAIQHEINLPTKLPTKYLERELI